MDAMTNREIEFAEDLVYLGPMLRKQLSREQIVLAERVVQRGVAIKDRCKARTLQYSVEKDVLYEILEEERIGRLADRATHGRA